MVSERVGMEYCSDCGKVLILVLNGHGLGVLIDYELEVSKKVLILVLNGHGLGGLDECINRRRSTVLILVLNGHGLGEKFIRTYSEGSLRLNPCS